MQNSIQTKPFDGVDVIHVYAQHRIDWPLPSSLTSILALLGWHIISIAWVQTCEVTSSSFFNNKLAKKSYQWRRRVSSEYFPIFTACGAQIEHHTMCCWLNFWEHKFYGSDSYELEQLVGNIWIYPYNGLFCFRKETLSCFVVHEGTDKDLSDLWGIQFTVAIQFIEYSSISIKWLVTYFGFLVYVYGVILLW